MCISIVRLVWLAGLVGWAPSALGAGGAYLSADSFSYSEPVPLRAYFNDWRTPFSGGDDGHTYNWLEAGAALGAWRLGVLARYDYYTRYSAETAEFYHRIQNRQALDIGRTYHLELEVEHFSATGLRGAYRVSPWQGARLELGLSYLHGERLAQGDIRGTAVAVNANDYDFTLKADYRYSQDQLFKRRVSAPEGHGYSVDVKLVTQLGTRATVNLWLVDLAGTLYWRDAPYTRASATSDTKTFDAQGYVRFGPTLSGVEGNRDFRQRLPPRAFVQARYRLTDAWSGLADLRYTAYENLVSLGVGRRAAWGEWQGLYLPEARAVTLRLRGSDWQLDLSADQLAPGNMRTLGLNISLNTL